MFVRKLKSLCLLSLFLISIFFLPPVGLQGDTSKSQNEKIDKEDSIKTGSDPKISASVNYDSENGVYSWWDPNFTYRLPIEINSTFKNRTDYSVKLTLNFTDYLKVAGWLGALDPESIRVVEYELDSGNNYKPVVVNPNESGTSRNVIPSKFIPLLQNGYDANTNAIGQLWFQMNGKTLKNTNRTLMVYFDTVENTGDLTSIPSSLVWSKDYNWETDVMGDGNFHLAFGCYQYAASGGGKLIIYNEDLSEKIYESYPHASVTRYLDPIAGDFDGDGNVELAVFDHDRYLWVMDYNPATGQMYDLISAPALPIDWDVNVLRTKFGSYDFSMRQLLAADYDNDGYTELIGLTSNVAGQQRLIVFNLTRSGTTWVMQIENFIDLLAGNPYHLNIADINFDGYMDFIVANYSPAYNFSAFLFDGTSFTRYIGESTSYSGQGDRVPNEIFAISTGEVDNDGNIEIVITDYDNTVPLGKSLYFWQWNRATSSLQFEQRVLINNTQFSNPTVGALYDYDYDGYDDILLGNYDATGNSSIDIIEVTGPEGTAIRFNDVSEWGYGDLNVPYQLMLYPRFADINNDGKVELVSGSRRDSAGANYGAVIAWNQDSQTPIWTSEQVWSYAGTGAVGYYSMMNIFGSYNNYVYRMEPSNYIWKSKAEAKNPTLEVFVMDVDMAPVSNAKVTINKTINDLFTTNTNTNGLARFDLLLNGEYDIQVNYTNVLGEVIVGTDKVTINSAEDLYVEKAIITNLWQVKFNVTDVDSNQYTSGKINLYDTSKEDIIKAGILNLASQNKFTWLNRSEVPNEYNYTITYENNLYNPAITDIVDSKVVKLNTVELGANFNETLVIPMGPPNDYQYVFDFNSGRNQLLNWVNISISGVVEYVYKVQVFLVIQGTEDLIANFDISGTSTTDWTGNASLCIKNKVVRADSLRSNQIRIKIFGINSSVNNGIINVTLFDEQRADITVPMTKKHIKLVDENQINANGMLVHVYNNPSLPGTDDTTDKNYLKNLSPLVNLTTIDGIALDANNQPFYYLTKDGGVSDGNYTITAEVMNDYQRLKWDDLFNPFRFYQNFTILAESQVQFQIQFSMDNWETEIYYLNALDLSYDFAENILLRVNVTANDTTDELPAIAIPASMTLRVWSSKTNTQVFTTTGFSNEQLGVYVFNLNFKDAGISLPTTDYTYLIGIFASTPGYGSNPNPIYSTVTINPISAQLQINRKIDTTLTDITGTKVNLHWGEKINLTMYYHSSSVDIENALVKLDWEFDSMVAVAADTNLGNGYYTYEIDSGKVDNLGTYRINFYASQTNFSSDNLKYIDLVILPIQTTLGGNFTLLGVNQQMASVSTLLNRRISINVTDSFNVTFIYRDLALNGVTGAETISYTWILYDKNNEVVDTNIETLFEIGNGRYDMDMNTENLQVGEYTIILTIQKDKYEARQAAITLQIKEKTFNITPVGSFSSTYQIRQTKDNQFNLSISLVDLSRNMQPLLGATVSLDLGDYGVISLTDDNNDGIYTHMLDVSGLSAFIAPITLSGELTITLENYTTQTKSVTIVVKMDEIFEGFPMFYFIVIVGIIGSLVIGLGTYKYVQQARIPEFIKKCDATSKVIAKKKSLNASTPFVTPKRKFLIDELFDGWNAIGLNVENALEGSLKKDNNLSDSEEGI